VSEQLDFTDRARRLELRFEQPGRAVGRWRRQAVVLDESGRLRVSLLSELGQEEAEDGLPPRVPTSIPELGLRSAAPSRLLRILDRPELRAQVTGLLLASVRSVEVREAEVVFQLVAPLELPALKHALDASVALVQRVQRELERTPVAPSPPPAEPEWEHLSPEILAAAVSRNQKARRWARRLAFLGAVGVAVTLLLLGSGRVAAGILCGVLGVYGFVALLLSTTAAPACPACGVYLSSLFVQRRCPRCDLFME
jgi:hypothetical protein